MTGPRSFRRWQFVTVSALLMIVVGNRSVMAQDCASGATFTGPIRITSGGTYTGNWQSLDPATPAVQIFTTQPVTIIDSRLRGPGDLLIGHPGANVTVQESCFVGAYPTARGAYKGRAIALWRAANVLIEHNDFDGTGGYELGTDFSRPYGGASILILQYLGDRTPNNTIKIRYNRLHNLDGRFSDGLGGYLTTAASGYSSGIQIADLWAVPGVEIAWNQIINDPYQSGSGDSINVFDSTGTAASPIQVHDNYIQGGWDSDPANGDGLSYFGSAITTDGRFQTDPNLTVGFLKIHHNQAVGFGNLGMSISLGHDVEMYSNRAVSSGQLPDGTSSATSYATGFQYMNSWRNNPPSAFFNNSVHDNLSGVRKRRNGNWEREDYRFELAPTVNSNNASFAPTWSAAPTIADEANEFVLWTNKLAAQGVRVGRTGGAGVPGAPRNLTAAASGSTVTLAWTAPAGSAIPTTYYIEAGSAPTAANLANFSTGNTMTMFSAAGVGHGTYYVRVRAANAAGTSAPSNEEILVVLGPQAPEPPTGLTAAASGSVVQLNWNAPTVSAQSGVATGYIIEAGSGSGRSDLASFATGNTATSFSASGVGAGSYYIRVRATNAVGPSPPSNEVLVVVSAAPAPGPPIGLTATSSGSSVHLSWNPPTTGGTTTGYIIEAGGAPGMANLARFATGSTATSFAATGVGSGTYYIRVLATNAAGTSPPSIEATLVVGGGVAGESLIAPNRSGGHR
jgi:hypothetical protein